MEIIEVTKDTFDEEVLKSEKPVLVDFNAAWCGPCKSMKRILDEIAASDPDYKIVSVDIDEEDELAEDHNVASIPTLAVFKGGKESGRSIGLTTRSAIEKLIEE